MSDQETEKILTDAEHVENMLTSQGWNIIRAKLDEKILDLQNIANIDMEKPETLAVQLAARRMATDLVFNWLKGDVYGFVEQARANSRRVRIPEDHIIDRGESD